MTITKEELLERVNALLPAIASRAKESEEQRRPHDDTIKELIDAEVMQILVPKRLGGHELHLDTMTAVARAVSSACMSTGWVTTFYVGPNWMLTKFSEQVQSEVFADRPFALIPIQPSPTVEIKKVSGGYEVSGRQSYSSGIMHGDWLVIASTAGEDARTCVMPVDDVQVDDVWYMSGMAGTGSNDVVIDGVFVPEYRTIPTRALFEATPSIHDNPMYTIPLLPFIFCEVLGVYAGGLEGATAAYDAYVKNKVTTWGGEALAQKQATHINLGGVFARTQAAGVLLDRHVQDTQALVEQQNFSLDVRLDLKLRACYIANTCRDGVNEMMARSGTKSFAVDAPLQRYFRDLNTLATHAFLDWGVGRELFGRHRLGLEPNNPLF